MPMYRKKPVTIEARCFVEHNGPDVVRWVSDHGGKCDQFADHLEIRTLEGVHRADLGDWVIKGVKGEFYPCKPDIFAATYELVSDAPSDEDRIRDAMAEARDHPGRTITR
jgi:hypothetical protein